MNRSFYLLAVILSFLILSSISAADITGKVVGIADGDTITVLQNKQQIKIRLAGIDTPEKSQDFGSRAKKFTSDQVFKKQVRVEKMGTDRYGRIIGMIFYDGSCLNEDLVRAGYAWVYRKYCDYPICSKWMDYEKEARRKRIGLWVDSTPIPPWEYRHGGNRTSKLVSKQDISSGAYHGNLKSHVFHKPSCKAYNCKNCTATFGNRDEAIAAGYRPCGGCRP